MTVVDVIRRAREAQQEHDRRINVQLELDRVETERGAQRERSGEATFSATESFGESPRPVSTWTED